MPSTSTDTQPREAFGPRRGGPQGSRHHHGAADSDTVAMYGRPPRQGRGRGGDAYGFGAGGPAGFGPGAGGPGGYGAGGFGPGGPGRGGPGGHDRGRHGGRGRGPRRGDVRLAILRLLAEEPMHGYQIITELSERTGGGWRVSPGSVYPTLQALADQGLVTAAEAEGRRVFSLTDVGRAEVEAAEQSGTPAPWQTIADSVDQSIVTLRSRVGQVMSAARQVGQFGTAAQVEKAGEILAEARRALYGLLAEDEQPAPSEPSQPATAAESTDSDAADGAAEQPPDA